MGPARGLEAGPGGREPVAETRFVEPAIGETRDPVVEDEPKPPESIGDGGSVRNQDPRPHHRFAPGEPGGVPPAGRGETKGGLHLLGWWLARPAEDSLDKGDARHERKVADGRHGAVMVDARHPERNRADGPGEALDELDRPILGSGAGNHDPRSALEEIGPGRRVTARLPPGHRMTPDERQTESVGPLDDRRLRARHVGQDHSLGQAFAEGTAEGAQPLEDARWRTGEEDEVGPREGRLDRSRGEVDDALAGSPPRTVAARAPGRNLEIRRPEPIRLRSSRPPEGANDRAADETEAEEGEPHDPIIGARAHRSGTRALQASEAGPSGTIAQASSDRGCRRRRGPHIGGCPVAAATARRIRVLLVDDHQLLTGALSRILAREPDIEVVGVAASVAEARSATRQPVDVVLMDYRLPDGTGAEATRALKLRHPTARVVMLTALADDETILESIQAGADGYLTKDRAVDEVVGAVRAAFAGDTLLPRAVILDIARRVAIAREQSAERPPIEPLTPREFEVLRALAQGQSSREICDRLLIAPNTLRTHVQNIMGKLHVHSKLEAVAFALRHRLIELPRED